MKSHLQTREHLRQSLRFRGAPKRRFGATAAGALAAGVE